MYHRSKLSQGLTSLNSIASIPGYHKSKLCQGITGLNSIASIPGYLGPKLYCKHSKVSKVHCKKGWRFSRPQPGFHWPNSPWAEIIIFSPARDSLVSDIPAGDGKIAHLFYSVNSTASIPRYHRSKLCQGLTGLYCIASIPGYHRSKLVVICKHSSVSQV